jgi:hypothetical protein
VKNKRQKPAPKESQLATASKWIEWYGDALRKNDDKLRKNVLNTIADDYDRNFYDDEIFLNIIESIEIIDNNLD